MTRYNSQCIPPEILRRMKLEDRKALGVKTPEEAADDHAAKLESDLQKKCESYLMRHAITYLHLSPRAREKRGWPDLTFCLEGKPMAIELKTATGRLSDDQKRVLPAMERDGWHVHVVRSYREFVRIVEGRE